MPQFLTKEPAMAKKYYSDKKAMNRDAGMISEDRSAPCLLPRNVIDKEWPRTANYTKTAEADLFMGVQKQMSKDASDLARETSPKKY